MAHAMSTPDAVEYLLKRLRIAADGWCQFDLTMIYLVYKDDQKLSLLKYKTERDIP